MNYHGDPEQDVMRLFGPFGIYRVGGCEIKVDPDDAAKINTRSYTTEEISEWFKVPLEALSTHGIVSHKDVPLVIRGADSFTPDIVELPNEKSTQEKIVYQSVNCLSQSVNLLEWHGCSGEAMPAIHAFNTVAKIDAANDPECTCETLLDGHHADCPYMRAKNDRR